MWPTGQVQPAEPYNPVPDAVPFAMSNRPHVQRLSAVSAACSGWFQAAPLCYLLLVPGCTAYISAAAWASQPDMWPQSAVQVVQTGIGSEAASWGQVLGCDICWGWSQAMLPMLLPGTGSLPVPPTSQQVAWAGQPRTQLQQTVQVAQPGPGLIGAASQG